MARLVTVRPPPGHSHNADPVSARFPRPGVPLSLTVLWPVPLPPPSFLCPRDASVSLYLPPRPPAPPQPCLPLGSPRPSRTSPSPRDCLHSPAPPTAPAPVYAELCQCSSVWALLTGSARGFPLEQDPGCCPSASAWCPPSGCPPPSVLAFSSALVCSRQFPRCAGLAERGCVPPGSSAASPLGSLIRPPTGHPGSLPP